MLNPETLPASKAGGRLRSRAELLTMMGVAVRDRKTRVLRGKYRMAETQDSEVQNCFSKGKRSFQVGDPILRKRI